jgi:hypothetical protein
MATDGSRFAKISNSKPFSVVLRYLVNTVDGLGEKYCRRQEANEFYVLSRRMWRRCRPPGQFPRTSLEAQD